MKIVCLASRANLPQMQQFTYPLTTSLWKLIYEHPDTSMAIYAIYCLSIPFLLCLIWRELAHANRRDDHRQLVEQYRQER